MTAARRAWLLTVLVLCMAAVLCAWVVAPAVLIAIAVAPWVGALYAGLSLVGLLAWWSWDQS